MIFHNYTVFSVNNSKLYNFILKSKHYLLFLSCPLFSSLSFSLDPKTLALSFDAETVIKKDTFQILVAKCFYLKQCMIDTFI